jgi:hypothetical protein
VNLNTITEVKRPASRDEIPEWREGYAWLAGGTWLFSTPQIATRTLVDLETLRWPPLGPSPTGLEIAATCTIAELERWNALLAKVFVESVRGDAQILRRLAQCHHFL